VQPCAQQHCGRLRTSAAASTFIITTTCVLFLSALCTAQSLDDAASIPYSLWRDLPDAAAPVLSSDHNLAELPYIAPVLSSDLGDLLFQIAAATSMARAAGVRCVVSWWDQQTAKAAHKPSSVLQDYMRHGITLHHMFPFLPNYADFEPAERHVTGEGSCFVESQRWVDPLPDDIRTKTKQYLLGAFRSIRCESAATPAL
jgi:hypothetical protein